MNNELNCPAITPLPLPQEKEVMALAAVGLTPAEIVAAMNWPRERRAAFCIMAEQPGSEIAVLIAAGRATGRAKPQIKLQAAAESGDTDAIKILQSVQARNRYNELLNNMDEDELAD